MHIHAHHTHTYASASLSTRLHFVLLELFFWARTYNSILSNSSVTVQTSFRASLSARGGLSEAAGGRINDSGLAGPFYFAFDLRGSLEEVAQGLVWRLFYHEHVSVFGFNIVSLKIITDLTPKLFPCVYRSGRYGEELRQSHAREGEGDTLNLGGVISPGGFDGCLIYFE